MTLDQLQRIRRHLNLGRSYREVAALEGLTIGQVVGALYRAKAKPVAVVPLAVAVVPLAGAVFDTPNIPKFTVVLLRPVFRILDRVAQRPAGARRTVEIEDLRPEFNRSLVGCSLR